MSWHYKQEAKVSHGRRTWLALCLVVVLSLSSGGFYYYTTARSNQVGSKYLESSKTSALPPKPVKPTLKQTLPWPAYGQSAYGTLGYGVLAVSDSQAPQVPIASLAKTITALAILQKKPLKLGEQGPTITITTADVAMYNEYLSKSGSVTKVSAGQQITQYNAMQAMLLASANNLADSLAIWGFGSIEAYTDYANTMVRKMGLKNTTVADSSGFSPLTVSTAEDMTRIAIAYMKKPVLQEITMQSGAVIPGTGTIESRNSVYNTAEEFGVKTGNTDQAGRCFIAATIKNNKPYSVAVVLGGDSVEGVTQANHLVLRSGNLAVEQDIKTAVK